MKKLIFIFLSIFMMAGVANAQKFAFVDTEYILDRIPSYKAALDQIDKISKEYEEELEIMYNQVEEMYKSFQNEKVLMTEEQQIKKENAIIEKEKEIKQLQQQYFGPEGEVFQKRQELIKPIQDEVYRVIKEISLEGGYAVIFDTASGSGIIYENPRYNRSDDVLQKLGYTE